MVAVQASGFGKTESAGFKVDINENATANLRLKLAAATETVQVEGQPSHPDRRRRNRASGQSAVHQ